MLHLLVLAVAPGLFLLMIFYLKDRYERESLSLVEKVFLAGVMAVFPAALFEGVLLSNLSPRSGDISLLIYMSYLGIGFPEELMKFLAVLLLAYNSKEFNEPFDGVVYSVASSLGFATLENLFYVLEGGVLVGLVRAVLAVPSHALDGAVMGVYLGRAKMMGYKEGLARALVFPILLHGTYDFLLFLDPSAFLLLGIPLTLLVLRFALKSMRRLEDSSPFKTPTPQP